MTKKHERGEGAYASLTGFRRAVPIILFALALFIGLCFISKETGTFGVAIGGFLLGTFSIGGYFIPALFALHAFFYPSDFQKKRILSRIIFSVLLLIAVSALSHAIYTLGDEPIFSAADFYNDGKEARGGGFIGGVIAFALIKVVGYAGLIILAITFFALYVTYFLASERNVIKSAFKKLLLFIVNLGAKAEKRIAGKKKEKKLKRAEKEEESLRRLEEKKAAKKALPKDSELFDDEFFAVDNGMSEFKIEELGINESRTREDIELNPTLQEKVHPKSKVEEDNEPEAEPDTHRKKINTDYGFTPETAKYTYEEESGDIIVESEETEEEEARYRNNDSAESVFTKDFDPFDFAMNEKLASKQSTMGKSERDGVDEFEEPVARTFTESDIAAARRRAEFEMRKSILVKEYEERNAREAEIPNEQKTAESIVETVFAPEAPARNEVYSAEPTYEAPTAQESTESGYISSYKRAAEYAQTINNTHTQPRPQPDVQSQFKPFTYPTEEKKTEYAAESPPADAIRLNRTIINEPADVSETERDDTLLIFSEENESDNSPLTASKPEDNSGLLRGFSSPNLTPKSESVFSFEEADDEEIAEVQGSDEDDGEETDEGLTFETEEEIPEDKQNPEIKEYQKMFNIFSEVEKEEAEEQISTDALESDPDAEEEFELPIDTPDTNEASESNETENADTSEDEPPFDIDEDSSDEDKKPEKPIFELFKKPAPKPAPEPQKAEKPDYSDFKFPPIDLLAKGVDTEDPTIAAEIQENGEKLIDALAQFDVRASIKSVDRGPRITRYEIVPARGVKVSRVLNLFDDIALNLAAEGIRMEAPIPGKSAIGVEIPNKHPTTVMLRDLLESDEFKNEPSKTFSCVGKDVTGNPVFGDMAKMPHILIAGATGMGKSVCINSILISILYKARPDEVKFIMVDPKTVEFTMYNGIPHLLVPVVTDVKQAAGALMWAIDEMNRRYELMAKHEVRKLDSYNDLVRENPELGEPLPKIIIVIDELNDLMQQVRKPVEGLITNITQKARAAGIHMIIGTQRPSVDVITGVIKANVPSRISCKVTALTDSRTVLDQAGAEKLLGKGDMLFAPVGKPKPIRVQGAFVSDSEVEKIMKFLKSNVKGAVYDQAALEEINRAAQKCNKGKDDDDFGDDMDEEEGIGYLNDKQFLEAVELATRQGKISTSLIQRKISIGYGKAAKFIDIMEEMGLVSEPNGQKPRDVLISRDEWHEMLARRSLDD